jgi:large subunit ribosomal protein L20
VPRVTRGTKRRHRRKKILAKAKGFFQAKSKLYRYAKEAVDRAEKFAYVGRKLKKRDFRSLWIIRISAASRNLGLSYSSLMHGLKVAGIEINRKMLAEMAVHDPASFQQLAAAAQNALGQPVTAPAPKPAAEPKPAKAKPAQAKAAASEEEPAANQPAAEDESAPASKPSDE